MDGIELEPVFPDSKSGRKLAEQYSERIGGGGYWEDHIDQTASDPYHCRLEDGSVVDPEILALVCVAEVYIANPSILSEKQARELQARLSKSKISIAGMPVDLTNVECVTAPTEASWIAWKAGRGPRNEGSATERAQRIKRISLAKPTRLVPIMQEDGKFEEVPVVQPKSPMHRNFPA